MKFKKLNLLSLLGVLSLVATQSASAAVEGFNVDALLGVDVVSGGDASSSTNLGWGGRLGYHFDPLWEAGVSYTNTGNSTTTGPVTTSFNLGLLMADINYHLPQIDAVYFGARLGMGIASGSNNQGVDVPTTTNFAFGVTGGYDFRVSQNFTIGPKLSYTSITQSNKSNIGDFQAHAAFKYFF